MPLETPYFSVVIPCYRAVETLAAAVESVRAQSFQDFEILLIDDGSPDNTLKCAEDLAKADPRIRVFTKPNGGVSTARNLGVSEARGTVIAFLDADDIWLPEKLTRHYALFNAQPEVNVSYAQIRFMDTDGTPTAVTSNRPISGVDAKILLAENIACTVSNLLARREVFARIGGFDEALHFDEDKEWLFRAHAKGEGLLGIDEVLTLYRTSPDGLASDLEVMERDWLVYVDKVRIHAPNAVNDAFPCARALFLRNLARRALRLGISGVTPGKLIWRAMRSAPSAMLIEPRRWLMTTAAASLVALLPQSASERLLRRLDHIPARITILAAKAAR